MDNGFKCIFVLRMCTVPCKILAVMCEIFYCENFMPPPPTSKITGTP